MTRASLIAAALLSAAFVAGAPAVAQDAAPPEDEAQTASPGSGQVHPVQRISSVEVFSATQEPAIDIVSVTGLVSSLGGSPVVIVPYAHGVPSDGILDLILVAETAQGAVPGGPLVEVHAILPIEADHPFTGVRVRSATNAVTVAEIPGTAEATGTVGQCDGCVGKVFVAEGETPPAGTADGDVVSAADLPPRLVVVTATDGIPYSPSDPNRLTIVVGADGRITEAYWD